MSDTFRVDAIKVTAGYLDSAMPNWVSKLTEIYGPNLERLEVHDPDFCITAGLYGDYDEGVAKLRDFARSIDGDDNRVMDSVNGATSCMYFDDDTMRAMWLAEVSARLG